MNYLTKKFQWLVLLLTVASLFLVACGSDEDAEDGDLEGETGATIEIPQAYVFDSRFVEGESSVSYSGQVVRNSAVARPKGSHGQCWKRWGTSCCRVGYA